MNLCWGFKSIFQPSKSWSNESDSSFDSSLLKSFCNHKIPTWKLGAVPLTAFRTDPLLQCRQLTFRIFPKQTSIILITTSDVVVKVISGKVMRYDQRSWLDVDWQLEQVNNSVCGNVLVPSITKFACYRITCHSSIGEMET